jgi:hypothetical protein
VPVPPRAVVPLRHAAPRPRQGLYPPPYYRSISVHRFPRRALTLCPQLRMGTQSGARFPARSAEALSATLYGHFTQAIYRNRPVRCSSLQLYAGTGTGRRGLYNGSTFPTAQPSSSLMVYVNTRVSVHTRRIDTGALFAARFQMALYAFIPDATELFQWHTSKVMPGKLR